MSKQFLSSLGYSNPADVIKARDGTVASADQLADGLERAEIAAIAGNLEQAIGEIEGALGQLTSVAGIRRDPKEVRETQNHLAATANQVADHLDAAARALKGGEVNEGIAGIRGAFGQLTNVIVASRQQQQQ
jgi:hypothetical protein